MPEALININGDGVKSLEILVLMTFVSLLPSILIMMTSFSRIIIVLSFLRNALGLQQTPPNTVLIGVALFLTLFIMQPVLQEINEVAYTPYKEETITQQEALKLAEKPMKDFMLKNTDTDSINMFLEFSKTERPQTVEELPLTLVIPAFMTSELKRAFVIGFLLFVPFLLIDLVVASTLMSMGMIMLPPATIALPFKVLLFIIVNGWQLLFSTIVQGFH